MDETTGEVKMKLNLREKLLQVMFEVGNIPKEGKNTQGSGYSYQRAADIFPKVQKALAGMGVAFMASEIACDFPPSHETKNGATMFVATVKMRYTFHDIQSDEILVGEGSGLGFDTSDKALNKAKTAALKYFLKQTLLIGEDDDDSEKDTHETSFNRTQPPRQAAASSKPTIAPRTTGSTPPRPDYVSELQFKNLEDTAKRHLGEGNGTFKLAMWCKEFDCTKTTTTRNQWKTMMEWVVNGEPEIREPGDEPQEDLEAGFRASIDGDAPLSTDLDAALGTVNHTMNRIGEQNHGGNCITEGQQKRLFAIAKGNKAILKEVRESFGFQHDRDIPKGAPYERVVAALEAAVKSDE